MADDILKFRDVIAQSVPPWLTRTVGGRILYSLMLHYDACQDLVVRAIRARFPIGDVQGQLARIGKDRAMVRGLYESDQTYARRLPTWLDVRKVAPTPFGLIDQIASLLAPHAFRIRMVNDSGDWYTRNADGTKAFANVPGSWDWDGTGPTTRFWVILYPPPTLWTDDGEWGDDGDWADDGTTIGSTATIEEAEAVRMVVHACRAAHVLCANVILAFDDTLFDPAGSGLPDGDWNLWANRNPNAAYWDGV